MITIRFANNFALTLPINIAKSSGLINNVLIDTTDHEDILIPISPREEIFNLFVERCNMMSCFETCKLMETKKITDQVDMTYDLPDKMKEFYKKLDQLEDLTDFYEIVSYLSLEVVRHEVIFTFYNKLKSMSVPEIKSYLKKEGEVNMIKLNTAKEVKKQSRRIFSYVVDKNSN